MILSIPLQPTKAQLTQVFSSNTTREKFDMTSFFLLVKAIFFLAFVFNLSNGQPEGLKIGFYEETCPYAEAIVKKTVDQVLSVAPSLSGALLRLHFHDCFVRVSILHFN